MKVLITGGAGFIGSHLINRLAADGHNVVSVDNLSVSYLKLRDARLASVKSKSEFYRLDITDFDALEEIFKAHQFDLVYHIAAKPGVRESITNPFVYAQSNYVGTLNVFECAKRHEVPHVVAASSSSVYGRNKKAPFSEEDATNEPISVYASTKRAGELLAHTYCDLFGMNITNLRFFTVYGPYGRPDMAPWIFTEKIIQGKPIQIFDHGKHQRDFTYVEDIVEGCVAASNHPTGFNIMNIGKGSPIALMDFISTIEEILGIEAQKEFVEAQKGDVNLTYADISKLQNLSGYSPNTSVKDGMQQFISWYKSFHDC